MYSEARKGVDTVKRKVIRLLSVLFVTIALLSACGPNTIDSDLHCERVTFLFSEAGTEIYASKYLSAFELVFEGFVPADKFLASDGFLSIVMNGDDRTVVAVAANEPSRELRKALTVKSHLDPKRIDVSQTILLDEQLTFMTMSGVNSDPYLVGDITGNGRVVLADFAEFARSYTRFAGDDRYNVLADIDSADYGYGGVWEGILSTLTSEPDGAVLLADFARFARNYTKSHPYLGVWTFEGVLHERTTEKYGKVTGEGSGTATVSMANHEFHVTLEANIEVQPEKEEEIKFSIALDSSGPDLDFDFSGGIMTFSGTFKVPGDDTQYTAVLQGALTQDGNDIFTKVEAGTIKLEGSEQVLATWTGEKQ